MKYFIISSLILISLLVGCVGENNHMSVSRADSNYLNLANESGNASFCDKIVGPRRQADCYSMFAASALEPMFCERIRYTKSRNKCFIRIAEGLGDATLCDKTNNDFMKYDGVLPAEDDCYRIVATATENVSVCSKIETEDGRIFCHALLEGNYSKCAIIKEGMIRWPCFAEFAVSTENLSICASLKAVDQSECYNFAASKKQDPSVCDKTSPGRLDMCYIWVAVSQGNSSLCDKVQGDLGRDVCYQSVAEITLNYSLCDKFSRRDYAYKDCIEEMAKLTADSSICEQQEPDSKYFCYAEATRDASFCDKITSWGDRMDCNTALMRKNPL
jgi:hypothetical protein